LVDFVLPLLVK